MQSANIPHLYSRNGIYYYRNNNVWKSLRTRCKKEAFKLLISVLSAGAKSDVLDESTYQEVSYDAKASTPHRVATINPSSIFNTLIKAYLTELYKLANRYGDNDMRYWLIMIGCYTAARMNEIYQLNPEKITVEGIHIRGDALNTDNAKRSFPT